MWCWTSLRCDMLPLVESCISVTVSVSLLKKVIGASLQTASTQIYRICRSFLQELGICSSVLPCSLSRSVKHTNTGLLTPTWTFHPLLLVFLHSARNIVYRLQLNFRMCARTHTLAHKYPPYTLSYYRSRTSDFTVCIYFYLCLLVCLCCGNACSLEAHPWRSEPPTLNLTQKHSHRHRLTK